MFYNCIRMTVLICLLLYLVINKFKKYYFINFSWEIMAILHSGKHFVISVIIIPIFKIETKPHFYVILKKS